MGTTINVEGEYYKSVCTLYRDFRGDRSEGRQVRGALSGTWDETCVHVGRSSQKCNWFSFFNFHEIFFLHIKICCFGWKNAFNLAAHNSLETENLFKTSKTCISNCIHAENMCLVTKAWKIQFFQKQMYALNSSRL